MRGSHNQQGKQGLRKSIKIGRVTCRIKQSSGMQTSRACVENDGGAESTHAHEGAAAGLAMKILAQK